MQLFVWQASSTMHWEYLTAVQGRKHNRSWYMCWRSFSHTEHIIWLCTEELGWHLIHHYQTCFCIPRMYAGMHALSHVCTYINCFEWPFTGRYRQKLMSPLPCRRILILVSSVQAVQSNADVDSRFKPFDDCELDPDSCDPALQWASILTWAQGELVTHCKGIPRAISQAIESIHTLGFRYCDNFLKWIMFIANGW